MEKPKVLIVDDEYSFANYAKMILESAGFEVVTLLEGHKARETAASEKPNVILLDMHMRDITGTEAIRDLKADPSTARIPIILCSITKSRSEVQGALDEGAVDFLPKPLKLDELKRGIERALKRAP